MHPPPPVLPSRRRTSVARVPRRQTQSATSILVGHPYQALELLRQKIAPVCRFDSPPEQERGRQSLWRLKLPRHDSLSFCSWSLLGKLMPLRNFVTLT